ncbi:MAG: transposase [Acutalibacteraceae bacterium]|nr:transposase [Acutalibacteraceae bacterium]
MENKYPKRKIIRLQEFDYNSNGSYFVTICTKDKKALFTLNDNNDIATNLIKDAFEEIINKYSNAECPVLVVMPNHLHAIINICGDEERADNKSAPTISDIIRAFKRRSTVKYIEKVKQGVLPHFDKQIWQRSFYDHVIRNQNDYFEIYKYITENPLKWELDKLYIE